MNPNTCHNGGTCVSLNATDFTCTCDPKYTGITCETGDIPYNSIFYPCKVIRLLNCLTNMNLSSIYVWFCKVMLDTMFQIQTSFLLEVTFADPCFDYIEENPAVSRSIANNITTTILCENALVLQNLGK